MKLTSFNLPPDHPFQERNWQLKDMALDRAALAGHLGMSEQADALRQEQINSLFVEPAEPLKTPVPVPTKKNDLG